MRSHGEDDYISFHLQPQTKKQGVHSRDTRAKCRLSCFSFTRSRLSCGRAANAYMSADDQSGRTTCRVLQSHEVPGGGLKPNITPANRRPKGRFMWSMLDTRAKGYRIAQGQDKH